MILWTVDFVSPSWKAMVRMLRPAAGRVTYLHSIDNDFRRGMRLPAVCWLAKTPRGYPYSMALAMHSVRLLKTVLLVRVLWEITSEQSQYHPTRSEQSCRR